MLSDERSHTCWRSGHQAASSDPGDEQAPAAGVRQAHDLLSDPDLGQRGDKRHFDCDGRARCRRFPSPAGKWKSFGLKHINYTYQEGEGGIAGALGLANDVDTILRAAERLRNEPRIHFLPVGNGKERGRLQEQARTKLLSNVTFTGALPKTRMPAVLTASDVCVSTLKDIPMFRTTYPNKVFDYMAAGRPIVLAIDGVIREVVEGAGGGLFVSPGDDAAMAEVIQKLSEDRRSAAEMGLRARAYVSEHFHRDQQAKKLAALLRSLSTK